MKYCTVDLAKEYGLQGGMLNCMVVDFPWDLKEHRPNWKLPAVVVIPGGAYSAVSKREGDPVAFEFLARGFHSFVLDYSVGGESGHSYPEQLFQVAAAVDYINTHAEEWNVDKNAVFVVGFSAGGHLASCAMNCFDYGKDGDEIDKTSSRPDFGVLCYPVVSFDKYMHKGSRQNLIGELESEADLAVKLSLELNVKADTPPAFIWHTMNDDGVDSRNSLELALAMRAHKIPCELHVFQSGRHGVGLAEGYKNVWQWASLLGEWLKLNRYVAE